MNDIEDRQVRRGGRRVVLTHPGGIGSGGDLAGLVTTRADQQKARLAVPKASNAAAHGGAAGRSCRNGQSSRSLTYTATAMANARRTNAKMRAYNASPARFACAET